MTLGHLTLGVAALTWAMIMAHVMLRTGFNPKIGGSNRDDAGAHAAGGAS